jgi:pimeloyl-ACP methyl ester carboxylesterase
MNPIPMSPDLDARSGRRGLLRRILQFLLRRSTRWQKLEAVFDDGSKFWRICRAILYRLALVPMLTMLVASALVYTRTHPAQPSIVPDPMAVGCYYQPVDMLAEDGRHLEGWLVPALSAHDVLLMHDGALHLRRPAVVLAHDFGQTQQQMLPLIKPLNEKGWVVLVLGMRGVGTATPAGQTLGLNESMDIKAAVSLLRRQRFVDGSHIALIGVGSGANAALLAADRDSALTAIVLDAPAETGEDAIAAHINSRSIWLAWLNPLCKLAFEIGYGLDVRDLDMEHYQPTLESRPTLLLRPENGADAEVSPDSVQQIVDFLENTYPTHQEEAETETGQ